MRDRISEPRRQFAGRTLRIALTVGGLAASQAARAAADSVVPPSAASEAAGTATPPVPLAVFGDAMPEPGRATLSVLPAFANFSHSLIGTRGVSSQYIVTNTPWYWSPFTSMVRIVPQNLFVETQTVTLSYGLAKNLSVVLTTGLVEKHSDLLSFYGASNLIPRGMSFPGTDSLQDSSASLIWRAYEDGINRVKINLGLTLPTGSNHNLGGALLQTEGNYSIARAFYGMQSGTGTFDVLPGILYAGKIAPWSWGLSYRARLPVGLNKEGYMWGNYQEVNAWGGYTWFPGFTTSVRGSFNIQSPIVGADHMMLGKLQSANPNFYGGKRIEIFAGADIDGKLFGAPGFTIGVEAGVPLYQNLNGPQLSKNWQAGMALRWRVGEPETGLAAPGAPLFKGPQLAAAASPAAPWGGVYMGVNAGYTSAGAANTNFTYAGAGGLVSLWRAGALPSQINLGSRGFLGGVQVGYNRQFYDRAVAGLEADIQGLAVGDSNLSSWRGSTFVQAGRNQHSLGTVRGRVGYLAMPSVLLYGTGGLAFGETDLSATYFNPSLKPILNLGGSWLGYVDMRLGWAAGGGVEWMVDPKWSVKAEYLHYDLGRPSTASVGALFYANATGLSSVGASAPFNGHVARAGVNYHLNWAAAAPVTATY